jgi:hypothetical protein
LSIPAPRMPLRSAEWTRTSPEMTDWEILSLPGHDDLADLTPAALPAQYSYTQLFCWHYEQMLSVWSAGGVIFTDIDDAKNRLTVAVEDLATQGPAVRTRLIEIGIPLEAVDIIEEEPIMLLPGPVDPAGPLPVLGIAVGLVFTGLASVVVLHRRRKKRALQDGEIVGLPR